MRINNNLMAMNTHRQLGINTNAGAKSIEKLSSGYRINRAGDDAAGLAISEKMRGQIRGLNKASRNAQDSISLVQTAEGALNETQAILQRMRELAVQSANDTNVDADRTALQNEVNQLATEITRVSNNTEFNERKLLDGGLQTGNLGELTFHIGANTDQNVKLGVAAMDAFSLGVAGSSTTATVTAGTGDVTAASVTGSAAAIVDANTITATTTAVAESDATVLLGDVTMTAQDGAVDGTAGNVSLTVAGSSGATIGATADGSGNITIVLDSDNAMDAAALNAALTAGGLNTDWVASGGTTVTATETATATNGVDAGLNMVFTDTEGSTTSTVAIGATDTTVTGTGDFAGVTLTLDGTNAAGASTIALAVTSGSASDFTDPDNIIKAEANTGLDISTQATANDAIETINTAITTVSSERAKLGAVQNRLEHTIKNLDTSSENLQASESRIRDVDMAKEMMEFTKNNILQQAAQSMLAQANQAPQGVLQLLR